MGRANGVMYLQGFGYVDLTPSNFDLVRLVTKGDDDIYKVIGAKKPVFLWRIYEDKIYFFCDQEINWLADSEDVKLWLQWTIDSLGAKAARFQWIDYELKKTISTDDSSSDSDDSESESDDDDDDYESGVFIIKLNDDDKPVLEALELKKDSDLNFKPPNLDFETLDQYSKRKENKRSKEEEKEKEDDDEENPKPKRKIVISKRKTYSKKIKQIK